MARLPSPMCTMEPSEHLPEIAFDQLPIELNKRIAHFLLPDPGSSTRDFRQADADIALFSSLCRSTRNAIDGDNYSFWRAAFRERFALMLPDTKNKNLRKLYKHRAKHLRKGCLVGFYWGYGYERTVLTILIDLIRESFRGPMVLDARGNDQCPNIIALRDFILHSHLLLNRKAPTQPKPEKAHLTEPILAAVRLMCSQLVFNLDGVTNQDVLAIEDSQKAVYAATNNAPIYIGPDQNQVNMWWVLHCFNFFRYYMSTPEASSLCASIQDLGPSQRPSGWNEPLKAGSYALGSHWKGTYAFLEQANLRKLRRSASKRSSKVQDHFFDDLNIDEGKIQTLYLDFAAANTFPWPAIFEQKLDSLRETIPPTTRAQHSKKAASPASALALKNIMLKGRGEDLEDRFHATGWLNPLPMQCGIPGWQRITFMKHFEEDEALLDQDNLWAYEGVVLPGGKFILGRWWYASDEVDFDNDYNGPFILWAVDPEPALSEEDKDDDNDEQYE